VAVWDDVIPARDKEIYAAAGYGKRQGLGDAPALIVIDMTYEFIGDRAESVLESVKRWPHSSGEAGWRALGPIARVIAAARAAGAPVFFTRGQFRQDAGDAGRWAGKLARGFEWPKDRLYRGDEFVREIAPQPGDVIVRKDRPSAFFGTPLMADLNERRIDTILITGCTTSGCVRGTAIDAFSYNFRVAVVEDGVFDRGEVPHKVNLFDIDQKYADVITSAEAVVYFERVGGRHGRQVAE
jgi:nicotinamidase-related amidase